MSYGTRLACSICLATILVFCHCVLFSLTKLFVTSAYAEQKMITGSVTSSPSSGPVGATISVSGSGWSEPDGERVLLGYMIDTYCSIVTSAQASSFNSGSFSGSLQLPDGTPLGTYSICATFGTTTAIANTYTVLTESSPQISIAFSTQQATVSGCNYYPAGTTVNLFWETTNGSVIFTIPSAVSDSGGLISRTFIIPTSIVSGSYKIAATIDGQPTLNSSVAFSYDAPTPKPSPAPTPKPTPVSTPKYIPASTPSPASDPTPILSPTVVTTPVATPIATQTAGATTLPGSQNNGQTPSSGTSSNDTNTPLVILGASAGVLAILVTILIIVLYIRRKKALALHIAAAVDPTQSGPMTWQNYQTSDIPYPIQNGSMPAPLPWPVTSAPPSPQQLLMSPYAHLLQQPEADHTHSASEPTSLTPGDPNLESIKQQVQIGLFVTPGIRRDS